MRGYDSLATGRIAQWDEAELMALLIELVETCARYFWRIVLVAALVFGAVAYALFSAEGVYQARTMLLYKLGREYIYVPEVEELGARAPDPGDLQLAVNAEMQILNAGGLRATVVDRIGPTVLYPDLADMPPVEARSAAIGSLNEAISVSLVTGSYIVQLAVSHHDPELAAQVANQLVAVYLDRRQQIFRTDDLDTLRAELAVAEREVEDRETELAALLDGGDILSFETLRDIAVEEQGQLEQALLEAEASLSALDEQGQLITDELDRLEPMVIDQRERSLNPVRSDARVTELTLEAERRALAGQLGAGHPQVLAVAREIEALDELVAGEPEEVQSVQRTTANPLWLQAQSDRFSLRMEQADSEARRQFLTNRVAQNRTRLSEASRRTGAVEIARDKLRRQREQVAEIYTRLRQADAREKIGEGEQTNIRIIEPAMPPPEPIGPPKSIRLIVAVFLGGLAALAYLLAIYFSRQTIQSAANAQERLGVPVLGEIEYRTKRQRDALGMA